MLRKKSLEIDYLYFYRSLKVTGDTILGRWQSKKHQESLSLLRQKLQRKTLSDVTILELCSLLKTLSFQGKVWIVNCG